MKEAKPHFDCWRSYIAPYSSSAPPFLGSHMTTPQTTLKTHSFRCGIGPEG